MSGDQWRWETRDRRDEIQGYGVIEMWGDPDEQRTLAERWAADKMSLMLLDAEPRYEQLAGWRVRVWCERAGYEAVAEAEEWLAVLRQGPLARMRDRVELLPSIPARR